jgi:hypothetical protein
MGMSVFARRGLEEVQRAFLEFVLEAEAREEREEEEMRARIGGGGE